MKKTVRLLFGRQTAIGLSIFLQVGVLTAVFLYFNLYFAIFQIISGIVFTVAVVTVFCRDMPPESKISWLVVLIFAPFFGTVVYILFSHNRLSRRQSKLLFDVREQAHKLTSSNKDLEPYLLPEQMSQAEYIEAATKQCGYTDTSVKYYPFGETFFADYLKDLESAKEFIFLEYFTVKKGQMLDRILSVLEKKAADGVDVRFIYDDMGTINRLKPSFADKLREKGIKAFRFNKFIPVVSAVHNNRDHRKITVIDGKVGYTGGVNIGDEYINLVHPCGVWKDTVIRLSGGAVDQLTLMFLSNYCLMRQKAEPFDKFVRKRQSEEEGGGVVIPYGDGPKPIYDRYVGENVYLNLINSAHRYIMIATPYLICDGLLKRSLENAVARGVDVRIVMPHIPDKKMIFAISRSNYRRLQRRGVKIFEYEPGFVHAKQVLCDGTSAVVGTINLDYRSLLHQFENGVLMFNTDCIKDIERDFERMFDRSVAMDGFKQNFMTRAFCKVAEIFQPLL